MSQFIEPRGWSDMTQERKVKLIEGLANLGLLNMQPDETSNQLLDRMKENDEGSLAYLHAKQVIVDRGVEVVAQLVETKAQADTLTKAFGAQYAPMIPEAARASRRHRHEENGLSL